MIRGRVARKLPSHARKQTSRRRGARTTRSHGMGDTNENREAFDPSVLDRSVIALPLLKRMEETPDKPLAVIIDLNLEYHEGRKAAGKAIQEDIDRLRQGAPDQGVNV